MRDPDRIPEMLELLGEVWQRQPDLRLGQLVFNAARMRDAEVEDVFSIEDGGLRKGLIRYLEMIKAQETRPQDA
ncbi:MULTISPECIES: DUF1040 family protein [unclassified Variovorax]|jgi:uncharacterized protein YihD (DUF1040 family)|uniref:DUF1040 family protein n=1 Tax=unclassified Variovorax TaxID=663243 RepID=UPI001160C679|nr:MULTISPECIES: DUF1040 family protein [unclassified Variovorax]